MTHPPGIIAYYPSPGFAFIRAYVTKLVIRTNHVNSMSFAGSTITWGHLPPDAVHGETKLLDVFLPWSTTRYTLDYLVEWWYYVIDPNPTEIEWGGTVSFLWDDTYKTNVIEIATASADTELWIDLEGAPPSYWTPTVPP